MEHAQHIIDSTREIFSSMIMLDVTAGEPYERKPGTLDNSLSGIIGLAGKFKGMLAIHLPNQTAMAITTAFLGMDVEEINEDVCDAIGELANMVAGDLKTALDPKGSDIQLSIPSAIYGEEYTIDCLTDATNITVPFEIEGGSFLVELQIRADS